jgi:hypothetical protein
MTFVHGSATPRAARRLLQVFCALTAAGFVALFILAPDTSEYFAWTIQPPLTAAFLGAGYGAGFLLSVLCLRAPGWAHVRLPFVTITAFTGLTTVATALHLDRLHLRTPGTGPVAEPAAWLWLVVYVVVPVAMTVVLVREASGRTSPRATSGREPAGVALPGWLAALLAVEGLAMGLAGVVLFVAPATGATWWPWPLTPFTGRAVAAWLLAFAWAAAASVARRDLADLRPATLAYTAFGALQLLALVRFAGDVDASGARPAVYVALLVAVTVTGALGWWLGRSPVGPLKGGAQAT